MSHSLMNHGKPMTELPQLLPLVASGCLTQFSLPRGLSLERTMP